MGNTSSHFTRNLSNATFFVCLLVAIATIAQAQVKFSKPDFDTGKGPVFVAAADFNRDGLLDVVTANSADNTVSVLLNNGNATFGRRADYPTGKNPQTLVTSDFNGDGSPDVAVANQDDNTVTILLNNGDGTLKVLSTFAVGSKPTGLIAADFNKDGKMDLAVVNANDLTFSIFLGNGNGSFTHSKDYSSGPSGRQLVTGSLVTADFNGDGILDLAATNGQTDSVSIYLGNGDGTFHSGANFTLFGGASPIGAGRMVAADFNQDGKADLLVEWHDCRDRGCGSGAFVFAGRGDGTFDGGHSFPINAFDVPITSADFNGDHVPDIVMSASVIVVNPATVFTTGVHSSFPFAAGLGNSPQFVAGDFNGDGKADLVVTNSTDNTVSLLLGNGDGTFHQLQRYQFPVVNTGPDGIATADFNRDGVGDIVVKSTQSQGIWLYLGNGDGTLRTPVELAADLQPFAMLVADVNRDGLPDIVLNGEVFVNHQLQATVIRVLLSNGDGTFRAPIDTTSPFLADFGGMAVGDFNSDGTVDIVIRTLAPTTPVFTNTLAVFFGNGDGSFRSPVQTQIPGSTSGLVVGDFNRDGKLDVITSRQDVNIQLGLNVYLGNGDGTFHAGSTFGAGVPALTADLNHDGLLDLLVSQGNSIGVFFGNGDGTFRHQSDLPVGGGGVQLADINGDGRPDLVVSSGQIFILLGNGDGSFQQPQGFPVGGAGPAVVTDLNRDGAPDIAVATSSTFPLQGSVSLLLSGNGPPAARDFRLNLSATSATVKAGQPATATATIVAIGTFADSVTFSCTGLPAGAACSFNPAGVTPGPNGQATSTLTITTQAHTSSALVPFWNGHMGVALGLPVAGIVLAGIRIRKRRHLAFLVGIFLLAMLMLQGCGGLGGGSSGGGSGGGNGGGGGGTGGGGTPTGTFTVVITGASGGSPVVTHSQNFTLTVQ